MFNELTIDIPYLSLMDELCGVFCELFLEKLPEAIKSALYYPQLCALCRIPPVALVIDEQKISVCLWRQITDISSLKYQHLAESAQKITLLSSI